MTFPVLRIFVDFFTIRANRILHSWKYGAPFYFSPFLPSLSAKFLITQLCLGEFKTEKKKHGARITLLYSTYTVLTLEATDFPLLTLLLRKKFCKIEQRNCTRLRDVNNLWFTNWNSGPQCFASLSFYTASSKSNEKYMYTFSAYLSNIICKLQLGPWYCFV